MLYSLHYDSPLGLITVTSDGLAVTELWFDGQRHFSDTMLESVEDQAIPVLEQARRWLDVYFSGKQPDFTPRLGSETTPFRRDVREILLTIPYGETMTYGEIAARIAARRNLAHMSAQAVGGAVGHNGISLIVPCHRVIGADGSMTGYGGGIDRKIALLELERAL